MNINRPTNGKILLHGLGAGGITDADVEQRAREIAEIDGRTVASDADRDEARAELGGRDLPATTGEDVEGSAGVIRDPSEPPSVTGHQTPNREGTDEQKAVERLVTEGAEEAQHDQMLAAHRQERRQNKT